MMLMNNSEIKLQFDGFGDDGAFIYLKRSQIYIFNIVIDCEIADFAHQAIFGFIAVKKLLGCLGHCLLR